MLDRFFGNKNEDVLRLLTSRINSTCMSQLDPKDRSTSRSAFCEVVFLVPDGPGGSPNYSEAYPVVSRDISAKGLSLIHDSRLHAARILVGLQGETSTSFVRCTIEHSTPLGFGFYQIGLLPVKVISPNEADMRELDRRLEQFNDEPVPA